MINEEDDDDLLSDESDEEISDQSLLDLENIKELLDEGLEPRPKRNMNPNSLANLKKGGIEGNLKRDEVSKRDSEVKKRLELMGLDPIDYYRKSLMTNLIKEEINLEDLQENLVTKQSSSDQQRIRQMIYTTTQSLLLLGDALKVQAKQNKVEDKKSVSSIAEAFEEFRKSLPPEQANHADKFRDEIERLRLETRENMEKGETK